MRCSLCRRTNRAIFARLFPGHAYLLLCSACLDHINAQIADGLQHALLVPACHTKHASRPDKSDDFWGRLADAFVSPMRKREIVR
jgi:hypothetical protein